ncbi:DUF4817 domain-containing protein [Trichonephila clavipes]|nr:DUF4817 domain-containing protein [Trichonephila clavipes]
MALRKPKKQMKVLAHTWIFPPRIHFSCRQRNSRIERYTNVELPEMHLAFGPTDCNGRAAQRLFAQRYHRKQIPMHAFFGYVHYRVSESGFFIVDTQERERRVRTPKKRLCWIWYKTIPAPVCGFSPVLSGFPIRPSGGF